MRSLDRLLFCLKDGNTKKIKCTRGIRHNHQRTGRRCPIPLLMLEISKRFIKKRNRIIQNYPFIDFYNKLIQIDQRHDHTDRAHAKERDGAWPARFFYRRAGGSCQLKTDFLLTRPLLTADVLDRFFVRLRQVLPSLKTASVCSTSVRHRNTNLS